MSNVLALPAGTELVGDFRVERVLGAGGFGMTYLAEEIALARKVTIKEYFPTDFAARLEGGVVAPRDAENAKDYKWGLDRFIDEAQTLARFEHANIVKVHRYFRANDTAYMVLGFEEGLSLKAWLKSLGRAARQRELDAVVSPLLDALEVIHASDFLHRDIAPDNIIIRKDGSPVLIDFGSARGDIAKHSRTMSALVKPGYSPYEQYAENGVRQGPWTDIYALAATLYQVVCGKRPPDAPSRVVRDELVPAREAAVSAYRAGFLTAIDRALALDTTRRPQSIAAWRGDLLAPDPAKPGWLRRTITRAPTQAEASAAKTVALPGMQPPPPDLPGGKGGMAAFIDDLKNKSPSDPAIVMGGAVPVAAAPVADAAKHPKTTVPRKPTAQSMPPTETALPPPPPYSAANPAAAARNARSPAPAGDRSCSSC